VVEGWYGQPFAKPISRTREYIDIVRQVLRREKPVTSCGRALSPALSRRRRVAPRQAAALDHAPAARERADLSRRRGPEERRARRGDRRRLAAALLLAVPARGVRRFTGHAQAGLRDRGDHDRHDHRRPRGRFMRRTRRASASTSAAWARRTRTSTRS
jgi:hypothetical protein